MEPTGQEICPECLGNGFTDSYGEKVCLTCEGTGRVTPDQKAGYYQDLWNAESGACQRYEMREMELRALMREKP